jgi:hypothetical protein
MAAHRLHVGKAHDPMDHFISNPMMYIALSPKFITIIDLSFHRMPMIIHSVLAMMNPMLYHGYRLMLAMAADINIATVANHASF